MNIDEEDKSSESEEESSKKHKNSLLSWDIDDQTIAINKYPKVEKAKSNMVGVIKAYGLSKENKLNALIEEKNFELKYRSTWYFKWFEKTPRYPDLKEAISDLIQIFGSSEESIMGYYNVNIFINSVAAHIFNEWWESWQLAKFLLINIILHLQLMIIKNR